MQRRAKSDTLYWIVRQLSQWQIDRLKLLNDMYVQDSLQWRLVLYYREAKVWSREAELTHWGATRLDVLKSRTLKWVVRTLSAMGVAPGSDLLQTVTDIRLTVGWDAGAAAFEWIAEGKQQARRQEQFEQLLEILGQEYRLLQAAQPPGQPPGATNAVLDEIDDTLAKLSDLNRLQRVRVQHMSATDWEPAMPSGARPGSVQAVGNAVRDLAVAASSSVRATYAHAHLTCFWSLHSGQWMAAQQEMLRVLDLYRDHPWLSEGHLQQYCEDICQATWLAAKVQDLPQATAHLARLRQVYEANPHGRLLAAGPMVRALLFAAHHMQVAAFGTQAVEVFEADRPATLRNLAQSDHFQLLFHTACHRVAEGDFVAARQLLRDTWPLRKHDPYSQYAHCRVLELLCHVALAADEDTIHQSATNAAKYINRQPAKFEVPLLVCRHLDRLPSLTLQRNASIAHLQDLQTKIAKWPPQTGQAQLVPGLTYHQTLGHLIQTLQGS